MRRRSLLAAMLAASSAPAFVRAGSLMRLDTRIIVPEEPWEALQANCPGSGDWTIEYWIKPNGEIIGGFRLVPLPAAGEPRWLFPDEWPLVIPATSRGDTQ